MGDYPLSPEQTIEFARELKLQVGQVFVRPESVSVEFHPPAGPRELDAKAKLIPYAGTAGGVASWKHAKAMSEDG